jgi:hypothetical protein
MARTIVVGSLAGLVGGIIGALLTLVLQPHRVVQAEAAPETADETEGALDAGPRVSDEAQARRLESLERRLSLLTLASARANGEAAEADGATPPSQADVADPVFEAAVLDILDRDQERKEGERSARRGEVQKERAARVSSNLTEKLGLNAGQQAKLLEVITAHYEAIQKLRDSDDGTLERSERRARWDELTQTSDKKLAEFLSPAQQAEYQKLDPADRLSSGRGRGQGQGQGQGQGFPPEATGR